MRKVLISIAAVASAAAFATPAAAQYYPAPRGYASGYNNPYNYGRVRNMEVRIMRFRNDIRRFAAEGRLSRGDASRLDARAADLQNRLHWTAQNGLNARENRSFDRTLDRLRANMRAEMRQYRRGNRYRRF